MPKVRSPNYPLLSLGPALEAVRPAFKSENRNKMSRSVLAKHLGHNTLNGRALGRIGAVRAYGLLDGSGDELRVSDDAVAALNAPEGSSERAAALGRLALKPSLFQELRKDFPDTMPSLENLKFSLVKRQFTPDAAEKAAKSYLATMNLVAGIPDAYNPPVNEEETGEDEGDRWQRNPPPPPPKRREAKVGMKEDVFTLTEGDVTLQWPEALSAESFQDLEDWTKLMLRKIKRAIDEEAARRVREGEGSPT